MYSIILCSPSPGQLASEKITVKFRHSLSDSILRRMYSLILRPMLVRNVVPGVMRLESNDFLLTYC